jgi:hypothetical protein
MPSARAPLPNGMLAADELAECMKPTASPSLMSSDVAPKTVGRLQDRLGYHPFKSSLTGQW